VEEQPVAERLVVVSAVVEVEAIEEVAVAEVVAAQLQRNRRPDGPTVTSCSVPKKGCGMARFRFPQRTFLISHGHVHWPLNAYAISWNPIPDVIRQAQHGSSSLPMEWILSSCRK